MTAHLVFLFLAPAVAFVASLAILRRRSKPQPDPKPSRSEAIRRLLTAALDHKG